MLLYLNIEYITTIKSIVNRKEKMKDLKCEVCGKEIKGEYLQAKIDKNLKPTEEGVIVCSEECAKEYEKELPYQGKPIQHWSRITGYYQNVEGWNLGKRKELKDRKRYDILR
jgi:ribosome-binding protein aMBF1 (putative translation factor)